MYIKLRTQRPEKNHTIRFKNLVVRSSVALGLFLYIHGQPLYAPLHNRAVAAFGKEQIEEPTEGHIRFNKNKRLAFPFEPDVRIKVLRIDFAPKFSDHLIWRPKWTEKRNLRNFIACLLHFGKNLEQRAIRFRVSQLIGYVKTDNVDSGVAQHLSVFT